MYYTHTHTHRQQQQQSHYEANHHYDYGKRYRNNRFNTTPTYIQREREGGDRESQTTRNTPYWRTRRVSPELPVSPLPQMNKVNTNCKSPLVIAEVRTRGHKQEKKGGKLIT